MNHFDLYGIGNALVDVETRVTNQFLNDNNVVKGCMTPVEAASERFVSRSADDGSSTPACGC